LLSIHSGNCALPFVLKLKPVPLQSWFTQIVQRKVGLAFPDVKTLLFSLPKFLHSPTSAEPVNLMSRKSASNHKSISGLTVVVATTGAGAVASAFGVGAAMAEVARMAAEMIVRSCILKDVMLKLGFKMKMVGIMLMWM